MKQLLNYYTLRIRLLAITIGQHIEQLRKRVTTLEQINNNPVLYNNQTKTPLEKGIARKNITAPASFSGTTSPEEYMKTIGEVELRSGDKYVLEDTLNNIKKTYTYYKGGNGKSPAWVEDRFVVGGDDFVSYLKQEKDETERKVARDNIEAAGSKEVFMTTEANNTNNEVYNGDIGELTPGNYVINLGKQVTGIPEEVKNHIGEPITLISYGGDGEKQLRVVIGLESFAYISSKDNKWVYQGSNYKEEIFILDNGNIIDGNMTIEITGQINQKYRFDLYCNGVLINPHSITIDHNLITASKDLSRYEFEVNDIIIIKYNHK